jgi:hypothetical protein
MAARSLVAVFFITLIVPPASAQSTSNGYFQAGIHWIDLESLNFRLAQSGIPPFEQHFLTLGGGGHVEFDRIMIGGEGHGLLEQEQTAGGFERELVGGYGFFDVGFLFVQEPDLRAYVLAGLGGGGFELQSEQRLLTTFDEVLANPSLGAEMTITAFLLQAAIGVDYIARFNGGGGFRGLSVGLRAGFTYAPTTGEWEFNDTDAPGGPELGMTGPYIRLSFGGVGR